MSKKKTSKKSFSKAMASRKDKVDLKLLAAKEHWENLTYRYKNKKWVVLFSEETFDDAKGKALKSPFRKAHLAKFSGVPSAQQCIRVKKFLQYPNKSHLVSVSRVTTIKPCQWQALGFRR